MGDGEKLLTRLNSALKGLLGLDIFPRVPKKIKFCWPVLFNATACLATLLAGKRLIVPNVLTFLTSAGLSKLS